MDARDKSILDLRGEALGAIHEQSLEEETFQNRTLRPILKFQNNLFIASFLNYANKHKNDFHKLSIEKKLLYIENAIQKDIKFRNALKGMVIAMFTIEEFNQYIKNSSKLNKRMMSLLIERLKDQVLLLEQTT
ncbi:glyoxalase [Flavobacterium arcticum]|uniref:Glyoxalase n=1 Tax=Flavobacterium arcticum TaxID=1784713 RepID=A0A345HD26_9FLAO|nr:glyoxalase [Flavobacterium arcticum]AXG74486.1 glyoxalase [Flavobacterium arcticum]KAF2512392.1 glyoxalase [Flavobacterium arcticum]